MQRLKIVAGIPQKSILNSAELLVEYQTQNFIRYAVESESFLWTNMIMPTELFYAADLIPIHIELISGWLSTLNLSTRYIHNAHKHGFHANICSYYKAVIGALEESVFPPPKIAVFASCICDGGYLMLRYLQKRYHTKCLLLHVPYTDMHGKYEYVWRQWRHIQNEIERYIGCKIDNKRIENSIEKSNTMRQYLLGANKLREKKTTFYGQYAIKNMFGTTFLAGSQKGIDVAKSYYKEIKQKNQIFPAYRILWIHFAPLYSGEWMRYFEEELGCVIVFDITGHIYWSKLDIQKPLESLGTKILSHFYAASTQGRIKLYRQIIQKYRIEGIVMFNQYGCRAIPGSYWEIKQLSSALKIPSLELSGDCIDPEGTAKEQIKLRMEAFKEELEMRRYVFGS